MKSTFERRVSVVQLFANEGALISFVSPEVIAGSQWSTERVNSIVLQKWSPHF